MKAQKGWAVLGCFFLNESKTRLHLEHGASGAMPMLSSSRIVCAEGALIASYSPASHASCSDSGTHASSSTCSASGTEPVT